MLNPWIWRTITEETPVGYNTFVYKLIAVYIFIVNTLSQMINIWWFHLIIKQVIRNVKKMTGNGGNEVDL